MKKPRHTNHKNSEILETFRFGTFGSFYVLNKYLNIVSMPLRILNAHIQH